MIEGMNTAPENQELSYDEQFELHHQEVIAKLGFLAPASELLKPFKAFKDFGTAREFVSKFVEFSRTARRQHRLFIDAAFHFGHGDIEAHRRSARKSNGKRTHTRPLSSQAHLDSFFNAVYLEGDAIKRICSDLRPYIRCAKKELEQAEKELLDLGWVYDSAKRTFKQKTGRRGRPAEAFFTIVAVLYEANFDAFRKETGINDLNPVEFRMKLAKALRPYFDSELLSTDKDGPIATAINNRLGR